MPYKDSYVWKLRQKIGDVRLLLPATDTICVNEKNEILMIYNRDFHGWAFPGGSVEHGMSWADCAAQETLEEGGLIVRPEDLVPFASISGNGYVFHYQDGSTQVFTLVFTTNKFSKSDTELDSEEIAEAKWVSLKEAERLPKTLSGEHLLSAYQIWLKTKEFQQIVIQ